MGSQQQFCLKWQNHQCNLVSVFENLLSSESFVDVTLACDGLSIKAHRMILSACSPFFQDLFKNNPCQHPIVILKDMSHSDLKALVEFMYKGEVDVTQDQLGSLLKAAELLKIKGLVDGYSSESASSKLMNGDGHSVNQPNTNIESANYAQNMRKRRKTCTGPQNASLFENKTSQVQQSCSITQSRKESSPEKQTYAERTNSIKNLSSNADTSVSNAVSSKSKQFLQDTDCYPDDSLPSVSEIDAFSEADLYDIDQSKTSSKSSITFQKIEDPMEIQEANQYEVHDGDIEYLDRSPQPGTSSDVVVDKASLSDSNTQSFDVSQDLNENSQGSSGQFDNWKTKSMKLRKYACPYCPASFFNSGHLNDHVKSKHLGTRYYCQYCNVSFTRLRTLTRHVAEVHKL